jgi:hypothetical protein
VRGQPLPEGNITVTARSPWEQEDGQVREALDAYAQRTLPPSLAADAPTPATWPWSGASWQRLAQRARAFHAWKATFDFAVLVGASEQYPDEAVSGQLRPGAALGVATGRVVRPMAPQLSEGLRLEAVRLLGMARSRGLADPDLDLVWGRLRHISLGLEAEQSAMLLIAEAKRQLGLRVATPEPRVKHFVAEGPVDVLEAKADQAREGPWHR